MLREGTAHADWCEMTMSMMREKQCEACERRLFAHPGKALFAPEASDTDAQALLVGSFDNFSGESRQRLVTLDELRGRVVARLPIEALFLDSGERSLLERLIMENGVLTLNEWDDIGAAEALVSRLWCGFHAEGDDWFLTLPKALRDPLLTALNHKNARKLRERMERYEATIRGLLYIAGLLHASPPIELFVTDVVRKHNPLAFEIARRYLQATFEYITDANGDMILLHPGLADPYRLAARQSGVIAMELSEDMIMGAMNGILAEEIPLHEAICGALHGALRPDYDLDEAAEDLRMLAKQNVSLREMKSVMTSMLAVLPTPAMDGALEELYQRTPRWVGLKAALEQ